MPSFPDAAWRGVFASYRTVIADISECPMAFHFANLLAVIAAELGDRVRLHEGSATYMNFFLFCCGRTGTKKSAASDLVQEHIVMQMPTLPRHTLLSAVSSAEGLIRLLQQHANTLLRLDEIADFFKIANRVGARIEPVLNQAFNLRKLEAPVKRARESLTAENYYLNILANGTPEHVQLELSETMFVGGLLNRFLVFAAEPTGVSLPIMGIPDQGAAQEIAARITSICAGWQTVGTGRGGVQMTFTPEAQALHAGWYHQNTKAMKEMPELVAKSLTRLDVYVKKLASVYCLLETAPTETPRITEAQMVAALAVLTFCQASMLWMTEPWSGPKSTHQRSMALAEERVAGYMQQYGCTTERYVYRHLHLGADECRRAVDALASTGMLTVVPDRPRMLHFSERCTCFV